jgi:hypothetical protein
MSNVTIDQLMPGRIVSSGFTRPPAELPASEDSRPLEPLILRVAWGDLTCIPADLHVVGHYRGVMPTNAEQALDFAISGPDCNGVIAEHTRRRWLVGALGQVSYFPGRVHAPEPHNAVLRAAVAGMGRAGTFTQDKAAILYESLLREVIGLGYVGTLAVVPIGAGAGNLTIRQVARSMVAGCREAMRTMAAHEPALREIVVVEVDRLRAEQCHRALVDAAKGEALVKISRQLTGFAGGLVGPDAAAVHALRTLLDRMAAGGDSPVVGDVAQQILDGVAEDLREPIRKQLTELSAHPSDVTAVTIEASELSPSRSGRQASPAEEEVPAPTRVTVQRRSSSGMVWSALTARATVPEREVAVNSAVVSELISRLTAPSEEDARTLPPFLTQFLVPTDLQNNLAGDAPLVLEVDAYTATVPWEFLIMPSLEGEGAQPLVIRQCLARQMRTTYARTDIDEPSAEGIKALIIADPGDPARNQDLPHARAEGVAIAETLTKHKVAVDLLIGAPGTPSTTGARSASRLDVLARIVTGTYDIVHYSGHGVFDPVHPELSGWLFADGLLAARELAQFTRAPQLVMANACWSAARPDVPSSGDPGRGSQGQLTPVLADEFLRVGTGHFIGATWRLPDRAAQEFATSFYDTLLGTGQEPAVTVGEAVRRSRRKLWEAAQGDAELSAEQRSAWAAYQYYGEPGDYVIPPARGQLR